jgi:sugar O-acyltransferase (sialic acid O-acetyltransferase NeuD family)
MTTDQLVIIGSGGFGREVAQLSRQIDPGRPVVHAVTGEEFLRPGLDDVILNQVPAGTTFVCAIGDPEERRRATELALQAGLRAATLIHPSVDLSGDNRIGRGAIICAGVIITTGITIGDHVHLNLATTVGHDAVLHDYATTAPGVNISGFVTLEAGAYVGTGASIINGSSSEPLVIGAHAVVGAGACVVRAVSPGTTVVGVPARELRPKPSHGG